VKNNSKSYEKLYTTLAKRTNGKFRYSKGKIFPSNLGMGCEQNLRYGFLGTEQKKDFIWAGCANVVGNAVHDFIQNNFKDAFGDEVIIEKYITKEIEGVRINGRVDMILNGRLYEFKTVNKDKFSGEPDKKHLKQIQWYMGLLKKDKTVLSYFNRSDGLHLDSFEIDFDQKVYDNIVDKIKRVIKGKHLKTDTRECRFCPYSWTCESYKRPSWK